MSKLTIVARIETVEGKEEFVKEELLKLIEPTRKEEGCLQYDLHRDNENPNVFLYYEKWESRELWQKHMNNPFLAKYLKATDGAVSSFVVSEMTHIK